MSNIQINPYAFGSDAISFDNVVNVQTAVSGTTLAASLTVSSNDNRMLIVSLTSYIDPADNPSGITFVVGGVTQNLQLFNDYGDTDGNGSIWYIANPTVGAGTITATWSSAFSKKGFSGYSFYNVASYGIANFTTAVGASNVANGSITPTTEGAAIFSSLSWVLGGSLNARPVSTLDYQYYIYTGGKTGGSSYNLTPTISSSNAMNYTNIDDNGSTSESAPYRIGMIEMKPASYPFSPIDLPDVELWYDFSDLSTITKDGSDRVSKVTDKINSLNYLEQSVSGSQPLWQDNTQNGNDVISTIGDRSMLDSFITKSYSNSPTICAAVLFPPIPAVAARTMFWNTDDYTNRAFFEYQGVDGANDLIGVYSGASQTFQGGSYRGTWAILVMQYGSSGKCWINGVEVMSGSTGTQIPTAFRLGCDSDGINYFSNTLFGEIVTVDGAMSTANRVLLQDYLTDKWIP